MIDYHSSIVAALKTILPTHYELILHSGLSIPCISYQETNNYDTNTGDTIGYSRITYRVKVWANSIGEAQKYTLLIDNVLRPLGWKRTNANELQDNNSTIIQKILTYEALATEVF